MAYFGAERSSGYHFAACADVAVLLTLHFVDEAVMRAEHPKLCLQGVLDKRSLRLGRQRVHKSYRCDNDELILVASEAL